MIRGKVFNAEVSIGEIELGEISVTTGLDGTMTLVFGLGNNSIGELDEVFRSNPSVTIDGEVVADRKLQAYRVDASGMVEVSFLGDETEQEEDYVDL